MKNSSRPDPLNERPTLDFSNTVRGKYYARMQEGTHVVLIAPDLMDTFPDSDAVNDALRSLKRSPTAPGAPNLAALHPAEGRRAGAVATTKLRRLRVV
jgi:hypothetical protein